MKRKVKKFAGNEGSVVRTRSDKEFEEDSKYGGYGRYMPKTKEYTFDEIKDKLSGLFGGKSKDEDSSSFKDLKSVGEKKVGVSPQEEINRQIKGSPAREIEGKEFAPYRRAPESKADTSVKLPGNQTGKTSYVSEEDAPYKVEKTTPSAKGKGFIPADDADKPKADKKAAAPKKNVGEDAKPLPGKKDNAKPQNLPSKKEKEKEPTPYKDVVKSEDAGSQSFAPPKKEPPLRKIGKAIKGTLENANKPFRSSMYDKMKGRKDGGSIKMAKGGSVSSASSRGDGIAQRGKTKGKIY
jgi:hypothetical protein